jgi:cytidylate kinase
MSQFKKATKQQSKLRMALVGPSGSGKTYTSLAVAKGLGERVALIDTERGSASKYSDLFNFDVLELDTFSPQKYVDAIHAAQAEGYDVLVIDSLSHAWMGKDGALEQVDKAAARTQAKNNFTAWREVTPMHNALVDAILQSRMHVIVTMRVKTEYVMEKDERSGKTAPRKVGLAPVQRDGLEYEFDVVADLDLDNQFIVSKTRCPALRGEVFKEANGQVSSILRAWLDDGVEPTVSVSEIKAFSAELQKRGYKLADYLDLAEQFKPGASKALSSMTVKEWDGYVKQIHHDIVSLESITGGMN